LQRLQLQQWLLRLSFSQQPKATCPAQEQEQQQDEADKSQHEEQQDRQQQDDGSYSGQKVTCTVENKRGTLPDIVMSDELVLWDASCLRGSYSQAVQQVTTRPADAARWH
jgi:hypothetical protein